MSARRKTARPYPLEPPDVRIDECPAVREKLVLVADADRAYLIGTARVYALTERR